MSKNRTDSSKTLTATFPFRQPSEVHSLGLTYSRNPKSFQVRYYASLNQIFFHCFSPMCRAFSCHPMKYLAFVNQNKKCRLQTYSLFPFTVMFFIKNFPVICVISNCSSPPSRHQIRAVIVKHHSHPQPSCFPTFENHHLKKE